MMRCRGFVIARSHRASQDARLSTGDGDVAIHGTQRVRRPLDCFAPLAMTELLFQQIASCFSDAIMEVRPAPTRAVTTFFRLLCARSIADAPVGR